MTFYISKKQYEEIVNKIRKEFPNFDESKVTNDVIIIPMKFENAEEEINRIREIVRKAVNEIYKKGE